ncbi:MAG: hypothetical protein ABL998_12580 [Planctomycetota bacterium]
MIATLILDPFYLYLTMNQPRDVRAIAARYDLPEAELCLRARRERWDERVRRFELDVPGGYWDQQHRQCQFWLALLVILASEGTLSGARVGSVAVGTDLLVQVQGDA